jgi:chitin disaccharide deacetylase
MVPRLILNADDFGLTLGVNRAVEELHQAGALTSATLMACGPAFDDAVRIAHENPALGVGCHIVLLDGAPTAPAHEVPTLLEPGTGQLRSSLLGFLIGLYTGGISTAEIEREAIAQIRKLQSAGIYPTHIDTHKHTHVFPRVTSAVLRAAAACGVQAIRNPIEPAWSARIARNALRRQAEVAALRLFERAFLAQPEIACGEIKTTQGCLGVSATGSLDAETMAHLLEALPAGTWELVTHPGYVDEALNATRTILKSTREVELNALLAQVPQSKANRITFADLSTTI